MGPPSFSMNPDKEPLREKFSTAPSNSNNLRMILFFLMLPKVELKVYL